MTGPASFKMTVYPDDEDHYVGVKIEVSFPAGYPEEPPEINL
jgi:ubiquitin-protein ligase